MNTIFSTLLSGLLFLLLSGRVFAADAPVPAPNGMVWVSPLGIFVGTTEVTQAEYQSLVGSNPSSFRGPKNPVDKVTWQQANEFCRLKTQQLRRSNPVYSKWKATLPTEQQWMVFAVGASLKDAVTGEKKARNSTAPVASLGANKFGLYDLRGNVWEWCLNEYYPKCGSRVVKGASWYNNSSDVLDLRFRGCVEPNVKSAVYGFRYVLVPTQ